MSYIDTSVLVACYCPEPFSATAQQEIRKTSERTISPLTEVEFHSALALRTRTGDAAVDDARKILSSFQLHKAEGVFRIVPIEAREHAVACSWLGLFATTLRTVDALHLAAAFCNGLTLITADKELAQAARHFGVKNKLIS